MIFERKKYLNEPSFSNLERARVTNPSLFR